MKILLLTQWFEPEPAFKGLSFAHELSARGHQVEVVTGFPNYPGGKVYPGYRIRLWQWEMMEGIPVLRVPLYPSHDRSKIGRILNYLTFAISATIACMLLKRPDVIYAYHAPATIGLPAIITRVIRGVPFVYDINDLWPDTLLTTGMIRSEIVLRLIDRWCNFIYSMANQIVVVTPGFRRALINRGVCELKLNLIYNWCNDATLHSSEKQQVNRADDGPFRVLFAGTMGLAQGLDSVLEAARICAASAPRAEFVFIGGGVERERLELRAAEMKLSNVRFLPRRPMSEMGHVLSTADVLLVHLKNDPLFQITIPSKTSAYLAVGKPILMAVRGDAAALVERSGGGVVCEPEDPASIATAVAELASASPEQLAAMGRAGRKFYETEISMAVGAASFERVMRTALT
jgi:colanic acid biosynthesis glycosyl transferase WcaI